MRMSFHACWILALGLAGCHRSATESVTIYCAQDQVYAEPIFQEFTRKTGIGVNAIFDSEAVKTVGIANRLLAEQRRPVADLFWGNEEFRTRQLASKDVFDPVHAWIAIGHRARCLVVNTQRVSATRIPTSLASLTNGEWRGRVAIASPLFGSTSTHFHFLRQHWGEANWRGWCQALLRNQVRVVEGNSQVVQAVERGQADLGLTDTDDVLAAQTNQAPVARGPWSEEYPLLFNTVGLIRNSPHRENALRLLAHLKSDEVRQALMRSGALEPSRSPWGTNQEPPWDVILRDREATTDVLRQLFEGP
jgi:iron(III) transport system substrate-binding protein